MVQDDRQPVELRPIISFQTIMHQGDTPDFYHGFDDDF